VNPRFIQYFEGCCSHPGKEVIEMLIETFIRKQLGLKAHIVTKVEKTAECMMIIHIDRLGGSPTRGSFRTRGMLGISPG